MEDCTPCTMMFFKKHFIQCFTSIPTTTYQSDLPLALKSTKRLQYLYSHGLCLLRYKQVR